MEILDSAAMASTVPLSSTKPSKRKLYILFATAWIFSLVLVAGVVYLGTRLQAANENMGAVNQCSYNGKTYKIGDSFQSTDGCNSCGCSDNGVVCTLMACEGSSSSTTSTASTTSSSSAPATSSSSSSSSTSTIPTSWKSYSDSTYSFRYPADWSVRAAESVTGITIASPKPNVTMNIYSGTMPYGFEGSYSIQKSTGTLKIEGVDYSYDEITYYPTSDANDKSVYVDLKLPQGAKQYQIMFGSGYPVNGATTNSVADYQQYRSTILQILSTLTIK